MSKAEGVRSSHSWATITWGKAVKPGAPATAEKALESPERIQKHSVMEMMTGKASLRLSIHFYPPI